MLLDVVDISTNIYLGVGNMFSLLEIRADKRILTISGIFA